MGGCNGKQSADAGDYDIDNEDVKVARQERKAPVP